MSHSVSVQPQAMQGYSTSHWNSEVMDCFEDMEICLCGAFVPCILACRVASQFGECFCLPCLPETMLAMRTGIRERYHIPGTICKDCVCLTFCGPCTLCQMARELKHRN
ncbi:cornifelin homolog A-like [Bufo bufo]|uniref:cornifelin homolog A-like n=1 Tax=Bufo bufo TaxID=8384 RepID=UPI001ABE4E9B|nr:cornifelin homolog A-like [Bufo bufo]